jgi:S1-C subfamily serine protease
MNSRSSRIDASLCCLGLIGLGLASIGAGLVLAPAAAAAKVSPQLTGIATKVSPALVDVSVTLGFQNAQSSGTGMVLSPSGEVVTNNDVIVGATAITVTDVGNHRTYDATVVGYDQTDDVAVLALRRASKLRTLVLGASSKVKVNDHVVALGNAGGGGGTPTVVSGKVTALNQSVIAQGQGNGTAVNFKGLIATNAPIQSGDAGGPLIEASGNVIGMLGAANTGTSGATTASYAIPSKTVKELAEQIERGRASKTVHIGATAFIGVEVGTTATTAAVLSVATNSPAQQAGLVAGDVITSLGGQTVGSPQALTTLLAGYHPDDHVQLDWVDASGQQHTATIELTSGPAG